ncbi:hypothetical protein DPMN_145457 [Dreissena polymorpha]|uniref:Uncharacterized protein n=1 Tax=Dreissena polymorpha TaxID=45954 RepID=A0A9D4F6Q9_DREPO|nr:hypothetical protein DPMN_145457 [Dreissena polymorpha]
MFKGQQLTVCFVQGQTTQNLLRLKANISETAKFMGKQLRVSYGPRFNNLVSAMFKETNSGQAMYQRQTTLALLYSRANNQGKQCKQLRV